MRAVVDPDRTRRWTRRACSTFIATPTPERETGTLKGVRRGAAGSGDQPGSTPRPVLGMNGKGKAAAK